MLQSAYRLLPLRQICKSPLRESVALLSSSNAALKKKTELLKVEAKAEEEVDTSQSSTSTTTSTASTTQLGPPYSCTAQCDFSREGSHSLGIFPRAAATTPSTTGTLSNESPSPNVDEARLGFMNSPYSTIHAPMHLKRFVAETDSLSNSVTSAFAADVIAENALVLEEQPLVLRASWHCYPQYIPPAFFCSHCLALVGADHPPTNDVKAVDSVFEPDTPNRQTSMPLSPAILSEVSPDLLACPECSLERYCSEKCREDSWREYHRAVCPGPEGKRLSEQPVSGVNVNVALATRLISRLIVQLFRCELILTNSTRDTHALLDAADARLRSSLDWSFHNETIRGLFIGGDWDLISHFPTSGGAEFVGDPGNVLLTWYWEINETFSQSFEPLLVHSLRNIFLHPALVRFIYGLCVRNFREVSPHNYAQSHPRLLIPHHHIVPRVATFFAHSCSPNLRLSSVGGTTAYSATRLIEPNEPLTVSFSEVVQAANVFQRRLALSNHYGFWCRCDRCVNESNLSKKHNLH